MAGKVFLRAPKDGNQAAYGAKMAKKYGAKDKGGCAGSYCSMSTPTAAQARSIVAAMKADGLDAWDGDQHVLMNQRVFWEMVLKQHGYELAVEKMKRYLACTMKASVPFKIPAKGEQHA